MSQQRSDSHRNRFHLDSQVNVIEGMAQKAADRGSTTSHFRRSTAQKPFEDDIQLNIKRGSNLVINQGIRSENGIHRLREKSSERVRKI